MIQPWIEKGRSLAFKKYSKAIDEVAFQLPDGTNTNFYLKVEGPSVCVLGFDKNGNVITVKQYRPGPNKIFNELPGGYVDSNEEPYVAAEREFLEETGYKGDFTFVGTCFDDAYSSMMRYCFVAIDCIKVSVPQDTSTEQSEVELLTLKDFRALLRSGNMTDIEVGYLGLDYLNKL